MNSKNPQLAEKFLFHMQVNNMLSQKFDALRIFLTIFFIADFSCVLIERQMRRSYENILEQNWCSQEETSSTKDYRGQ